MKKIIASTLAAVVFNIFSPVAPLAHAGIIEDQLSQVIAQDANVSRIQQLLTVKKQSLQIIKPSMRLIPTILSTLV